MPKEVVSASVSVSVSGWSSVNGDKHHFDETIEMRIVIDAGTPADTDTGTDDFFWTL